MTKNLDVTTYRNGDPIPQVRDQQEWQSFTTGAWCWYLNDSASYNSIYGKLYNWYAVNDSRGLAPLGWHVPSDEEWTTLANCLGGESVAGGKMKEAGTSHWLTPNGNATNESGFTALPGDARFTLSTDGWAPNLLGDWGNWWSSTENVTTYAFCRQLNWYSGNLYKEVTGQLKSDGFSVRCVRD